MMPPTSQMAMPSQIGQAVNNPDGGQMMDNTMMPPQRPMQPMGSKQKLSSPPTAPKSPTSQDPHTLFNALRSAATGLLGHPEMGKYAQDILNTINKGHSQYLKQAMSGVGLAGKMVAEGMMNPVTSVGAATSGAVGRAGASALGNPPTMPKK